MGLYDKLEDVQDECLSHVGKYGHMDCQSCEYYRENQACFWCEVFNSDIPAGWDLGYFPEEFIE